MADTLFREDKAVQVASRLLSKAGGDMDVIKLVKLVYFVDRSGLERYGRTVTFDWFYAMRNGPVVSSTLDCINAESPDDAPIWSRWIAPRQDNTVRLIGEPAPPSQLSRAEIDLIDQVFAQHGHKSTWEIVHLSHGLPEWHDPEPNKRERIRYRDVLRAAGWSSGDIAGAISDLKAEVIADRLLG